MWLVHPCVDDGDDEDDDGGGGVDDDGGGDSPRPPSSTGEYDGDENDNAVMITRRLTMKEKKTVVALVWLK